MDSCLRLLLTQKISPSTPTMSAAPTTAPTTDAIVIAVCRFPLPALAKLLSGAAEARLSSRSIMCSKQDLEAPRKKVLFQAPLG